MSAFMTSTQRCVTGEVRLRFSPGGGAEVVGRRSPVGLYVYDLATYDAADAFRHEDGEGFVRLFGLGIQTWSARQGGADQAGAEQAGTDQAGTDQAGAE
jgi:argininosuccinate synthase